MVNALQLKTLFPNADPQLLIQAAAELSSAPSSVGLDTPLRLAHFLAQVRQEAGAALQSQVESLNYAGDGLTKTFAYYREHLEEARQDGRQADPLTGQVLHRADQPTIANKVYAGRLGNGDVASGDGWRFRGRGFIQVTGRANYRAVAACYRQAWGDPAVDFERQPELLESMPHALRSAACYWVIHGLPRVADQGPQDAVVDRVTGLVDKFTDSYADRRHHFQLAWHVLA